VAVSLGAHAQVLGAVGRVLVTVGLLLLLFVAYQLWGTGIYQARAQDDLAHQSKQALERNPGATPATRPRARRPRRRTDHRRPLGPITIPPRAT
jgi:sortase A